jgi:hypothetical protein
MKSNKIVSAALAGLLASSIFVAGEAFAAEAAKSSCNGKTADAKEKHACKGQKAADAKEKHACKGKNSCKGQGADAKNACKGKGSCSTAAAE